MKRYDLRPLKDNFYDRMFELVQKDLKKDECGIFIFEIGDFSPIHKVSDLAKKYDYTVMNSLKFNEVDWTVVIKNTPDPDNIPAEPEAVAETTDEEA